MLEIVLSTIGLLILGGFTSFLASEKGYPAVLWFWLGFILPIIGLLVAIGLPKKSS